MKAKRQVLVIDDARLIHELLGTRLADLDVDLHTASSGHAGLVAAGQTSFDLIILDIQLKDISGFEVCRLLKQNPQTHDIPVIFLTGDHHTEQKIRAFDLGAVDYVVKPFDPHELRARVRAALHTKELLDMLTQQAQIDGLTGLRNRRYFDQRLDQEIERANRHHRHLGLMLIDIDQFKEINDSFGHPKGDQIIQHVASQLQHSSRQCDIPCRYGGDEFALILPDTSIVEIRRLGQRLVQRFEQDRALKILLDQTITISVGGAATEPAQHADADKLLCLADQALYASKRDGRCRCTIAHPPMYAA